MYNAVCYTTASAKNVLKEMTVYATVMAILGTRAYMGVWGLYSQWGPGANPSYFRSLLSFPSHRCARSSSLITLSRPSLTSRFKIANRSYYHSAPVLWDNFLSDLRHAAHHVIPSPIINSPFSDLSTSLFLKKLKTYLFHSSFPP